MNAMNDAMITVTVAMVKFWRQKMTDQTQQMKVLFSVEDTRLMRDHITASYISSIILNLSVTTIGGFETCDLGVSVLNES